MQTALKTETALSGSAALGFDPRVGAGVYDPVRQGSLTTAINRDHLGKGQSLQEAISSSRASQEAMTSAITTMAQGFVPNFATTWAPAQLTFVEEELKKLGKKPSGPDGKPSRLQMNTILRSRAAKAANMSTVPLSSSSNKATASRPQGSSSSTPTLDKASAPAAHPHGGSNAAPRGGRNPYLSLPPPSPSLFATTFSNLSTSSLSPAGYTTARFKLWV